MKKEHILIIRFSSLGDVAMAVPVVYSLAKTYPQLRITVLSREYARAFFEDLAPNVSFMEADVKSEYHGIRGLNALYRRLTAKNFTAIADFHDVLRSEYLRMRFSIDRYRVAHVDKHRKLRRLLTARHNKSLVQLPSPFKGYADVLGIIIAAGVFAAGLRATGLIDTCVEALKDSNDIARWGGSIGPWIMGVITGSGDAATLAFNETVTPHAKDFGMTIEGLGGLAFLTGALGRTMSPLAGVTILVSGIAMVNPLDVVKRTAIPCFVAVLACALLMV